MNVWGCIDVFKEDQSFPFRSLWIPVSMPLLMPVGSTIYLPSPTDWDGSLTAKIASYTLIGDVIECQLEIEGGPLKECDDLRDLLAVGYSEHDPEEIKTAYSRFVNYSR